MVIGIAVRVMLGYQVVPICAHTISVNAPINCGVALVFRRNDSSSTILPIANQREAFKRYDRFRSSVSIAEVHNSIR